MRKIFMIGFVMVMMMLGATFGFAEKVTIRFARQSGHVQKQIETLNKVFNEFQKQHPEINLVQEIVPGDELQTKIATDAANRNLPEIFDYWGFPYLFDMVAGGMLLNVEEYLKKSDALNFEDIPEYAWDYYRWKGKIWGIPTEQHCSYLLANKEMFSKLGLDFPDTYEELIAVGKKFNAQNIIPTNLSCKGSNPGHFWFSELYWQFPNAEEGLKQLREEWKFDSEINYRVAKLIADQKKNGLFPKDTLATGDWGPSFALYTGEKAAMCYSWTWMAPGMPPEVAKKSVFIDVPKMPGAVNDPSNFCSGGPLYGFVINADSFHNPSKQEAVIALADYLVSDEFCKIRADLGVIPVKEGLDINWEKIDPFLARILEYNRDKEWKLSHYHYFPGTGVWDMYELRIDQLWAGQLGPEGFVRKVQEELDRAKVIEMRRRGG